MAKKGRKTPETEIAATIRKYAAIYATTEPRPECGPDSNKDRAQGMLQAADIVDRLLRGRPIPEDPGVTVESAATGETVAAHARVDHVEARLAELEKKVAMLMRAAWTSGSLRNGSNASATPTGSLVPADGPSGDSGHGEHAEEGAPAARRQDRGPRLIPDASVVLARGEERILTAITQLEDARNDELTAMTGYKKTSLRTFLGNLRAAGYVESSGGVHRTTKAGAERAGNERLPTGWALYDWWLPKVSAGEQRILAILAKSPDGVRTSDLIGEATDLQKTSVRTYVTALARRKLIVRPHAGSIRLARILMA